MLDFFTNNIQTLSFGLAVLAFFRPEIGKAAHRVLNTIDFYPHSKIEVGFFDFGPTIAMQFTIRGRGGNQLINSICLELTRTRDGATYNYNWGVFRNISASLHGTKLEESVKAELATAFLLPKDGSQILNVQFQDSTTQQRFLDDALQLKTKFEDFIKEEKLPVTTPPQIVSAQDLFRKNTTNNDLVLKAYTKLGKEFYWEEGEYKIILSITTDKPRKVFRKRFNFFLSSQEVARLDLNRIGLIQTAMLQESSANFAYPSMSPVMK